MDSYERVHEYLSRLGMTTMESIIDSYLEVSHDRPVMDILDHLLSEELKHKLSKKTENMLNWSGFPFRKTMDDFDFSFQPSIDPSVIVDLFSYLEETNWKNRFDSSLVSGRYPISSTIINLNLEYVFILYSSLFRS